MRSGIEMDGIHVAGFGLDRVVVGCNFRHGAHRSAAAHARAAAPSAGTLTAVLRGRRLRDGRSGTGSGILRDERSDGDGKDERGDDVQFHCNPQAGRISQPEA
jgi:hypothetical protein